MMSFEHAFDRYKAEHPEGFASHADEIAALIPWFAAEEADRRLSANAVAEFRKRFRQEVDQSGAAVGVALEQLVQTRTLLVQTGLDPEEVDREISRGVKEALERKWG